MRQVFLVIPPFLQVFLVIPTFLLFRQLTFCLACLRVEIWPGVMQATRVELLYKFSKCEALRKTWSLKVYPSGHFPFIHTHTTCTGDHSSQVEERKKKNKRLIKGRLAIITSLWEGAVLGVRLGTEGTMSSSQRKAQGGRTSSVVNRQKGCLCAVCLGRRFWDSFLGFLPRSLSQHGMERPGWHGFKQKIKKQQKHISRVSRSNPGSWQACSMLTGWTPVTQGTPETCAHQRADGNSHVSESSQENRILSRDFWEKELDEKNRLNRC